NDYQPILTLCVDDNANEKSTDEDLNISCIDSAQVNCDIAVLSNDTDGDIESFGTTEDGDMPFYINDTDLSAEYATSIEIRGPPANEAIALTGMHLVEPNVDNFDGQVVYLDFDGQDNVTYNGPVTVEGIDVPRFAAPGHLVGQEHAIITEVLGSLKHHFAGSGVIFTAEKPEMGISYSTIYIGGDDSAFTAYGSFLGLAERIDVGNQDPCDEAFVFSDNLNGANDNLQVFAQNIANIIAHETGHLFGYQHDNEDPNGSVLSILALDKATNPNPADGSIHQDSWVTLGWTPGDSAVSHDIYFGESFADVDVGIGGTFQGNQTDTFFVVGFPGFPYPGGLVVGTTYYWRIDEVNLADPGSPWKGDVWSFTAEGWPEIDVEVAGTDDIHAHSFGTVEIGQSLSQDFTVCNEGNIDLVVTQVSGLISPFSISPVNSSGSADDWVIPAGGTQMFTLSFSPVNPGNYSDTLILNSNDLNEGSYQIDVTGTATLFGGQQVISTQADGAYSVYACDLDGDGDNDILSASASDDKIAWYENQGGGTFSNQQIISTLGNGAHSVFACDLDGDGDNDVLSASYGDDKIAWYENLGSGVFGTQQVISIQAYGAALVYACDLDGDGDNDVLSASVSGDKIAWYENLGGGTFSSELVIDSQVDYAASVYACDLDGDGDNDVLSTSRYDDRIAWYENLGSGVFGSKQSISTQADGAASVYACDLDGDGDNDVLSASNSDDKIAWYENLGGGTFGGQQVISILADATYNVYACDLDGDGDNDVLSASYVDHKIAWYENQGGGIFGSQQVITNQADGAYSVYACDLDGDGDNDVLSASNLDDKIAWYENQILSPGSSPEIDVEQSGIDNVHAHSFGILNPGQSISQQFTVRNEGNVVLVVTQTAGLVGPFSISPANNSGTTDNWVIPAFGTQTFTVSFSPVNAGNYNDTFVITSNDSNEGSYQIDFTGSAIGIEIEVLGNGQVIMDGDTTPDSSDNTDFGIATLSQPVVHTFEIKNVGLEDLNLTGSPDRVVITGSSDFAVTQQPVSIVAANGGTTTFEVTFNPSSYGTQTAIISIANSDADENPYDFMILGEVLLFGSQQVISTQANGAMSVYACDLDGDGDNDVLSAPIWGDKLSWFENIGGGTFGSEQIITTEIQGARSVYACDLDGDGDNDVLSASYYDHKIAWYENLGSGTFGSQQVLTSQVLFAFSVYASDLDGDGDNDVISASYQDDTIAWYKNLGGGTFGTQQVVSTQPDGGSSIYACDLDGDSDNDILVASWGDNHIAWHENLGGGTFGSLQIISTQVTNAYSVYAIDLDGDGDSDVLSASGDKIAWYENLGGGTFGSQQVLSTATGGRSVYACDLDGDGDNDVLSASGDNVAWYENQGGGTFSTPQVMTTQVDGAYSVYACDLDGDGDNDVLSASYLDDKIAWYENLFSPSPGVNLPEIDVERNATDDIHAHSFGTLPVGQSVSQQFTVRNEGNAALVVSQTSGLVNPFNINPVNSSGSFDNWIISAGSIQTFTVSFSPVSPGNYSDTLVLTSNDSDESSYQINFTAAATGAEIEVLGNSQVIFDGDTSPGSSDNTYFTNVYVLSGSVTHVFTISNTGSEDLNLTGTPDRVVITGDSDFTVTQQPASTVSSSSNTTFEITFSPSSSFTKTATITITNNDYNENPYDFVIQGKGFLFGSQQIVSAVADEAFSVYACDLDGDGDNDILSASLNDDKIAWYENLGGGTFSSQQVITTQTDGAHSVYACDLDGDGDNDVLSASYYDDKIAWYENLGSGNFASQQVISTQANGPRSVYASDLDGDGDNDILSASFDDNKIAWYENLGSGNFGNQQVISTKVDRGWSVYACDLDGDGDNDVLSASVEDNKIAWYENQGSGTFGIQKVISLQAAFARSVYACDLDGDGDNDVLSASYIDNKIAWYENLGGGSFGSQQVISNQASQAMSVYACDLDGDGDNDVLSASAYDDKIAWYENLGGGTFGNQQIISTQADFARSVYACDLDGDGDNDVLSASANDDKIAWYENLGSPSGPQILLSEDFNDGNYNGWILVEQVTLGGPMDWSAATGVMIQSSNVHSAPPHGVSKLGTFAYWQAGIGWTDYTTTVTMKSTDNDALGVMFRYQDENNYYRFIWDKERNSRALVKCDDGVFTILAEDSVQYTVGQSYQVKISAQGSSLQVSIDGNPVFSVNDSTFLSGTIALYSWGNASSHFDDITVEGPSGANQAPGISSVTASPSAISDTETSQLQVVATDPDSGPSPLTYSWTVPTGQGSLDDLNIANPVYTPLDVGTTQIITLTVKVSDGADFTTQTVDITVTDTAPGSQILLSEDFNDGDYNGWILVEQGTRHSPMKWSAATGVMIQSSNIVSPPPHGVSKLGTFAYWDAGIGWTDYTATLTMKSTDNDALGVMFRYQDENNYYRFIWDAERNSRALVKCDSGVFSILDEDTVPYTKGQSYQVEIVAQGDSLQVSIDGNPVFSATDSSILSGSIALYSWGNTGSHFDDIIVDSLSGVNQAPVANAGPDQTTADLNGDGSEQITLDGSGSTDSDGTIQSYVWTEGAIQIATGQTPTVTLAVGTHDITLTVTDDDGATDSDTVTIIINSAPTVYFVDPNLKAAIEAQLSVSDPTTADMLGLTYLDASDMSITDLTGLEYGINLTDLYLHHNQISDISALSGLTALTDLYIYENQISDIIPLSGLANLSNLHIVANQISDLSPLSGLDSLRGLYLDGNQISDISPLSGLTNLDYLNLDNNQISDFSPISGLTNLLQLCLRNNQFNNVSLLSGLTNLMQLYLSGNQISDVSPLSGLTNLKVLHLYDNQISDISPLAGLTNLEQLWLSNNQI
ncbi:MAG: choice-of-anchor D domain-containing protein, partial [Planctomycetes bacterium]|nr:choice-of-anchor D domain-containing protein [Planctomycetota bacterium]